MLGCASRPSRAAAHGGGRAGLGAFGSGHGLGHNGAVDDMDARERQEPNVESLPATDGRRRRRHRVDDRAEGRAPAGRIAAIHAASVLVACVSLLAAPVGGEEGEAASAAGLEETPIAGTPERRGREYMAANGRREGVTTTASGLQYEVLESGQGTSPGRRDSVSVHYRGLFIDGRTFDSSIARGQPAQFRVDGVIAGWTEALQMMRVGDRWRLVIPPQLAYGEAGAGDVIGPNETLVFEVELLAVL